MTNPWRILGVHRGMDLTDIRNAYTALMRKHHPDAGGTAAVAAQVGRAWAVINAPAKVNNLLRQLAVVGKECTGCMGRGYQFKQTGLTTRTTTQCTGCGGSGFIYKEE